MSALDKLLSPAQQWLDTLESRERRIVIGGGIALLVILFYLLAWDPTVSRHEEQQLKHESQRHQQGAAQQHAPGINQSLALPIEAHVSLASNLLSTKSIKAKPV